jgi:hypothetical protein
MERFIIHHHVDGSITITNLAGKTVTKSQPFLERRDLNVHREPPNIIKNRKKSVKDDV